MSGPDARNAGAATLRDKPGLSIIGLLVVEMIIEHLHSAR
jgi:hypothetical protein